MAESLERQLYGALLAKAEQLGVRVHAIGNVQDHIHVAASIPPKVAVSECIRQFKGASSYSVNHTPGVAGTFGWQRGYGAITVGERSLEGIVAYVRNQKEHHRDGTTNAALEQTDDEDASARGVDSSSS